MAEPQRPPIDCLIGQDDFVAVSRYDPPDPESEVLLAIRDRTVTGEGVAAVVLDLDRLDQLLLRLLEERLRLSQTGAFPPRQELTNGGIGGTMGV